MFPKLPQKTGGEVVKDYLLTPNITNLLLLRFPLNIYLKMLVNKYKGIISIQMKYSKLNQIC